MTPAFAGQIGHRLRLAKSGPTGEEIPSSGERRPTSMRPSDDKTSPRLLATFDVVIVLVTVATVTFLTDV